LCGACSLAAPALRLRQRLLIRDLGDDIRDLLAEQLREFGERRLRVLYGVVQQGGHEYRLVVNIALVGEHVRKRDGVIDVRRRVAALAPLVAVPLGCERHRTDQVVRGRPVVLFHIEFCSAAP
jgi:hypothetical protein